MSLSSRCAVHIQLTIALTGAPCERNGHIAQRKSIREKVRASQWRERTHASIRLGKAQIYSKKNRMGSGTDSIAFTYR
jgi:hypothetical protein